MSDLIPDNDEEQDARRIRLMTSGERPRSLRDQSSAKKDRYSSFIKFSRILLPLTAAIIATIVFTWSYIGDDRIAPAAQDEQAPKRFGKNELLNPRFGSVDDETRPYTITANRAIQGETNEDVIILENPLAEMDLKTGEIITVKANQGAFRQDNQRLLLKGDVVLTHNKGYQLNTAVLDLDLDLNTAISEENVFGEGPAGTLEAKGLQGDAGAEHLIFKGPAKVLLNRSASHNSLEGEF